MSAGRPASPGVVVVLTAVGALVAGAAGIGAYLGVAAALGDRPPASPTDGASTPTSPAPTGSAPVAAVACPQPTIDAVQAAGRPGQLVQVIYVKGATTEGRQAEAWICRDSDGTLYYQGHELRDGPLTRAQGDGSLLLGTGIRGSVAREGDAYVGTSPLSNGTVYYRVSATEFAIVDGDRRTEFGTDFETMS